MEKLTVDQSDSGFAPSMLVVGYGNTLRGDDAVGQHVALAVARWNLSGLTVKAVQQLTPDLAEPLSRTDIAIFVDARLAGAQDTIQVRQLAPSNRTGFPGHSSDPGSLLALALAVYGGQPRAYLVTVPGVDFSFHEGLSATASQGAALAVERIAAIWATTRAGKARSSCR
jgi:hydrogenase maturation protease